MKNSKFSCLCINFLVVETPQRLEIILSNSLKSLLRRSKGGGFSHARISDWSQALLLGSNSKSCEENKTMQLIGHVSQNDQRKRLIMLY